MKGCSCLIPGGAQWGTVAPLVNGGDVVLFLLKGAVYNGAEFSSLPKGAILPSFCYLNLLVKLHVPELWLQSVPFIFNFVKSLGVLSSLPNTGD